MMAKKEEIKEPESIPEPAPLNADNMTELINKFDESSDRLEKANKYAEEIMAKQVAIKVEQTLGGTAKAGSREPQQTEEQKAVNDAKKFLSGTGYESIFDEPEPKPRVKVID